MKIGFFGVGNMGGPMAANLVKAGHEVTAFDLVPALLEAASAAGASAVDQPALAVQGAEVVISMLPSAKAVTGLYLGEQGILDLIDPDTLIIDCSTIDAATSRRVAGIAGDSGAGQVAKICNNMLLAVHMIGTAEALQMGVDHGLDPAALSEIMRASSGGNWSLEVYNPWPGVMPNVPASNGYQGGFGVNLMNKDLGLALEAALTSGSSTPMGALARSLYAAHANQGHGGLDFSSIQTYFRSRDAD